MTDQAQDIWTQDGLLRLLFGAAAPPDPANPTGQLRLALQDPSNHSEEAFEALAQGADPNIAVTLENYLGVLYQPALLQEMVAKGLNVDALSTQIRQAAEQQDIPYGNLLQETAEYASAYAFYDDSLSPSAFNELRDLQQSIGVIAGAAPTMDVDIEQALATAQANTEMSVETLNFVQFSALRSTLQTLEAHNLITPEERAAALSQNDFATVPDSHFAVENVLSERGHAYDHLKPGEDFHYVVKPGETAWSIAQRFHPVIGGENVGDSLSRILAENGMEANGNNVRLSPNQVLEIPVKAGFEIAALPVQPGDTLWSLAQAFNERNILDPALGAQMNMTTVEHLAQFNGMDVNATLTPGNMLYFPIEDDFAHIAPVPETANLAPQRTFLVTSEIDGTHHQEVYQIAAGVTRAVDPQDSLSDVYSYITSELGEYSPELRDMIAGAVRSGQDVVLNYSIENTNDLNYGQDILMAEAIGGLEGEGEVSFFAAAGNAYDERGDYTVATGFGMVDNSVLVGASRVIDGQTHLEFYSSSSADIVAPPLPRIDGQPELGTSFASPYMAALFRKMNERYGEALSHTEIMAAASLSTDLDLRDNDNNLLTFQTNGAGRPHHDRAGAGMIDPERWAQNLDRMVVLKRTLQQEAQMVEENVPLDGIEPETSETSIDGVPVTSYTYRVPVPADMTLDRMIIHAPFKTGIDDIGMASPFDSALRRIELESPSGFETELPPSLTNLYPTSALALEDVREGQYITLTTGRALEDGAYVRFRGFEDGNAIQLLRDNTAHMEPHAVYQGNRQIASDPSSPDADAGPRQSPGAAPGAPDIRL